MKRTGRQAKRSGGQMKGSGRQASREPDHKHPAWETNEKNWETHEKNWETNERKRETSQPGTRPDHPAPRRPFFKALRTPNSELFGEKYIYVYTRKIIGRKHKDAPSCFSAVMMVSPTVMSARTWLVRKAPGYDSAAVSSKCLPSRFEVARLQTGELIPNESEGTHWGRILKFS